jgi:hypothetical protein
VNEGNVEKYMNGMRRAQDLDIEPKKYKHFHLNGFRNAIRRA